MRHQLVAGIKAVLRPVVRHRALLERARYVGTPVLDPQAGNDRIGELIAAGRPFAAGKMGASELGGLRRYERAKDAAGHCASWGMHWDRLHVNAGVYPADAAVFDRFCQTFGRTLGDLDVLAVWFQRGEDRLRRRFAAHAELVHLTALEPFYHDRPWSARLAGKRVVVVTPFAATVAAQYGRREAIWRSRPDVLPAFDLRTVRCPLSAALAGPQYPDWFAALDGITAEMDAAPYDMAIVGAGAWGVPLVSHAKRRVMRPSTWVVRRRFCSAFAGVAGTRTGRWSRSTTTLGSARREKIGPVAFRTIENGCYW